MKYYQKYESPLGTLLLAADDVGLNGVWIEGQKYCAPGIDTSQWENDIVVLEQMGQESHVLELAKRWLDIYFTGKEPEFQVPLHVSGTDFQKEVWEILRTIPYGQTMTYGEIARQIAERRGLRRMSAQAVGGAVGRNPVGIIVPCHRVVGSDGSLTGYAGGIERKQALLTIEGTMKDGYYVPKKSKAP